MKRAITFLLFTLFVMSMSAYDFKSGNFYYNITSSNTVEVTSGDTKYSGDITIPSSVTYNDITYVVTSIGDQAFSHCYSITSITIPNSVTSIGRYAFAGCTLASISLPNSITSIGDAAFQDCESLKSITIPNSVTSVGSNQSLFGYCDSLTSIVIESGNSVYDSRNNCNAIIETATNTLIAGCQSTVIPNSVTSIGDEAFLYCTTLTSITIPNSVTSIGFNAFTLCTSLTSIAIPSSVERLADNVFGHCTSLTSIVVENDNTTYDSRNNCNAIIETATNTLIAGCQSTVIPNSVTSIGDYAFEYCSSLTSVTIPNSVTSIGSSAFSGCFLTSISLPESVTSIGDWAFGYCYGFDTIYANKMTPPSIGEGVFAESSPVCYVPCGAKAAYEASDWASQVRKFVELCEEKYTTLTYTSTDGNIVIPSYNDAFGANIVGNTYENGVGTITFDGPVTTIGYHAFPLCRTLASINIPNTVTSIGEYAFGFCTNLTELRIPKSVTTLGADENGVGIVYQAPNLQRIIVEEGNPVYDSRNNCNAIIETATNTLLSGCKNTSIPSGIKTIGAFAFWGCADLQTIEIPTSIKTIKQGAFYETGLTRFIIPSNVTLEDATYQNTQTILGGIFAGCEQLTDIVIPEGTTRIASGMLAGCSSLESLTIPNSVTSIGEWAFYDCDALTSITIPNGVTSIEEGTFMRCSKLTSITIPSGVTNIGYSAFRECILLSSVICEATTPPMLEDLKGSPVFTSSPVCRIPCGTKAAYEASDWAQYVSEFVEDCDNGSYSRNVRIGYNTICLPHGSSNFTGATFYEIAHILKNKKKIFFDEVKTLEAGKPYIFYPHSTEVTIYYDNTTSAIPLSHNGLHGTFDGITAASNFLKGKYLVAGDRMVLCGDGCSLAANRAYIELDEISDKDHPAIPGIKRVSMDYSEENATTALDNITDESIVDPMQEGIYDILGRKVDAPTVSGFYIINGKKVFVAL